MKFVHKAKTIASTAGVAVLASSLLAGNAVAHDGAAASSSFLMSALQGFAHPFSGLDHLAVMLFVGLWLARQTVRQGLAYGAAILSAFALALFAGGLMSGAQIAVAEFIVLATVFVGFFFTLGTAFGVKQQLSSHTTLGLVMLAMLAHGSVHGVESLAVQYSVGSILGVAALLAMTCAMAKAWHAKFTAAKV